MTTGIVKDKADEFLKELVGTVKEEVYEQVKWVALDDLVGVASKLSVEDCYFAYDGNLNDIDCYFALESGLTLMISKLVDEPITEPVVFSIWRGKALLISDCLPLTQIVETINSVYCENEEQ